MLLNTAVIGGADGPSAVFLAGQLGLGWLNLFGLILVILLLIPNIVYALKHRDMENKCQNRFMNILEQIGRYSCMFLMVFNIGIAEFGFSSAGAFLVYLFGSIILMISYWIIWILYINKRTYGKQMALAIIPTILFILCGISMLHILLMIFGIIFGIAHIYVTSKNRADE
ncbi:MAG: hypothetical protein IK115_01075 [Lachnospiraceae bacterium]|nr:hypothetical protein [Lachnospiraceae bacterium]